MVDKVLVDSGALQMVLNALERDALEGKHVRAEMRLELMQSITQPTQQGDAEKFKRLELEIRGITKMLPEKFDCSGVWAAFEAVQAKQGGQANG